MATTTPINGWPVPVSTDLVKDGAVAIETLGDAIDASVGSGLLAWQSWAPTLGTGWANGNGVWDAKYCKIGKTVHVQASFTLGSTTTKGSNMTCSLPVTAKTAAQQPVVGSVVRGFVNYLQGAITGTTSFSMYCMNVAGTYPTVALITATVPITWQTGDIMYFAFTYEAA
jgi:hypothetical protein